MRRVGRKRATVAAVFALLAFIIAGGASFGCLAADRNVFDEMTDCCRVYRALPLGLPDAFTLNPDVEVRRQVFPDCDYVIEYRDFGDFGSMAEREGLRIQSATIELGESQVSVWLACSLVDDVAPELVSVVEWRYAADGVSMTCDGAMLYRSVGLGGDARGNAHWLTLADGLAMPYRIAGESEKRENNAFLAKTESLSRDFVLTKLVGDFLACKRGVGERFSVEDIGDVAISYVGL